MLENIVLRPAQKKDSAAIQDLMVNEKQILSGNEVWAKESIKTYIENGFVFVAEQDDHVVGFVIGERLLDGGALVQLRIVEPDLRGQGIGVMLSDYFEQALYDMGITWMLSYARPDVAAFHKKRGASLCPGYTEVYKEL